MSKAFACLVVKATLISGPVGADIRADQDYSAAREKGRRIVPRRQGERAISAEVQFES
jgi:hypothetical protein